MNKLLPLLGIALSSALALGDGYAMDVHHRGLGIMAMFLGIYGCLMSSIFMVRDLLRK